MSFGSIMSVALRSPPPSNDGHSSGSSTDVQLAGLMEDYFHATRLQNSLKKRIRQLLKEREEEAKQKEDEAKEAWRKAQEDRKALKDGNALMKEKMKQAEMMDGDDDDDDDDEEGKEEKKEKTEETKTDKLKVVPRSQAPSPLILTPSQPPMGVQLNDGRAEELEREEKMRLEEEEMRAIEELEKERLHIQRQTQEEAMRNAISAIQNKRAAESDRLRVVALDDARQEAGEEMLRQEQSMVPQVNQQQIWPWGGSAAGGKGKKNKKKKAGGDVIISPSGHPQDLGSN